LALIRQVHKLPIILKLPRTSADIAREYFQRLTSKGIPCRHVITKIGLVMTQNWQRMPFPITFFLMGDRLSPEEAQIADEFAVTFDPFLRAAHAAPAVTDEGEVV
jgi:hypothetical protein